MNTTALEIIGVFLLVVVNAFFVVAEFAIVKVRDTRIAELAASGSRTGPGGRPHRQPPGRVSLGHPTRCHRRQPGPWLAGSLGVHSDLRHGDQPHRCRHRRLRLCHLHHHHLRRVGAQVGRHPQGRAVHPLDRPAAPLVLPDHPAGDLAHVYLRRGASSSYSTSSRPPSAIWPTPRRSCA